MKVHLAIEDHPTTQAYCKRPWAQESGARQFPLKNITCSPRKTTCKVCKARWRNTRPKGWKPDQTRAIVRAARLLVATNHYIGELRAWVDPDALRALRTALGFGDPAHLKQKHKWTGRSISDGGRK